MTLPKKEASLVVPASQYYRRRGYRHQWRELQFFEYSIDLYVYNKNTDISIGIELKLKDWRRAITQAMLYSLCADMVMVCVPKLTARLVDVHILKECGIGLLSYEGRGLCRQLIVPKRSQMVRKDFRDHYVDFLLRPRNARG